MARLSKVLLNSSVSQNVIIRPENHKYPETYLEKAMATHSSVLAWGITGMAEPGGLQAMRSHRVRHD